MANPDRAPVPFEFGGTKYRFVNNNAGKRAAEKAAGMRWPEVAAGFFALDDRNRPAPGMTEMTAMLFGFTRKFGRRAIQTMQDADELMDEIEGSGDEDAPSDLFNALGAAALGMTVEEFLAPAEPDEAGDEGPDEESGEDPSNEAGDEGEAEAPKAGKKGSKSGSRRGSRSGGTGKSSS